MYTCCPNCHTCFRISKPQLDVAQGHVRCGTCSKVFNGKQYLRNEMPGKQNKNPRLAKKEETAKSRTPAQSSTKTKTGKPLKKKPPQKSAVQTTTSRKQSTKVKSVNKASIPDTPSPPPDIDLFDYTSISRVQDASLLSNKSDFEEQDINDIFDDLESQHALRQPGLTAKSKTVSRENIRRIIPDNSDKPTDDNAKTEDTAIIDLSTKEDEWLNELTSDIESNDVARHTPPAHKKVTRPSTPATTAKKTPKKSTPAKTTIHTSKKTSRYEYVDPNELLKEEKGINEILQDMNRQLSLEIDTSKPGEADTSDISGMFKQVMQESKRDSHPAHNNKKDDFESSFLASLDSATLNSNSASPQKIEPPVDPTRIKALQPDTSEKPEHPAPAEIKDDFSISNQTGAADLPGNEDDVPYQLRDNFADNTTHRSAKVWTLYIAATLVLVVIALLQIVIFRSTDLADNYPALESTLTRMCNTLPCRYTGPQDVSQIKLLSRDIRLHPKEEKALLITATMVNRAKFKQPYPDITITLSDLSGDVIARRQFSAEKYLNRIYTPLLRMPLSQPVKIALEVIDPGRDAVNFEFTFH